MYFKLLSITILLLEPLEDLKKVEIDMEEMSQEIFMNSKMAKNTPKKAIVTSKHPIQYIPLSRWQQQQQVFYLSF